MSDGNAEVKKEGRRCAVEGCRAWRKGDEIYCAPHYRQWRLAVEAGDPDPRPKLVSRHVPKCATRSCRNVAMLNSIYCPTHAALNDANAKDAEEIDKALAELRRRLKEDPPDALGVLVREQRMLDVARQALLAHTQTAARTGWGTISAMHFMRLWTSAAGLMHDLAKSRFVMEAAGGGGTVQLIQRVYDRLVQGIYGPIDVILSEQPMLSAPGAPDREPDANPRRTAEEESLAAWIVDATHAVGSSLAADALLYTALQAGVPQPYGEALAALARGAAVECAEPADPLTLSDLLATLGDLISPASLAGGLPDVGAVQRRLEERRGA